LKLCAGLVVYRFPAAEDFSPTSAVFAVVLRGGFAFVGRKQNG
jgi:hypothetical protein